MSLRHTKKGIVTIYHHFGDFAAGGMAGTGDKGSGDKGGAGGGKPAPKPRPSGK